MSAGPWAAVAEMGGSVIGGMLAQDAARKAAKARQQALEELLALNPEMGASAYQETDPRTREAQMAALAGLENTYRAGGMDPQSRAALLEAQYQTGAAERGARDALVQNAASRGLSTSGASFAAQLGNQQGAANRNARAGAQAAGDARTRALQALSGTVEAAGGIRGQDYQKASALDAVERFNAAQRTAKTGMLANTYTGNAATYDQQSAADQERGRAMGAGVGRALGGWLDSRDEKDANTYNEQNEW